MGSSELDPVGVVDDEEDGDEEEEDEEDDVDLLDENCCTSGTKVTGNSNEYM